MTICEQHKDIKMQKPTAAQYSKNHGLMLKEVSRMVNKPIATLHNWFNHNNDLFQIVVRGCVEMKRDERINKLELDRKIAD